MTKSFVLPAKTRINTYYDTVSKGDKETYEFDCRPWQDDNSTITSVTWAVESGQSVSISNKTNNSGVVSALLSFTDSGKSIVSVLLTTATQQKKIWLNIRAKDVAQPTDDYGIDA